MISLFCGVAEIKCNNKKILFAGYSRSLFNSWPFLSWVHVTHILKPCQKIIIEQSSTIMTDCSIFSVEKLNNLLVLTICLGTNIQYDGFVMNGTLGNLILHCRPLQLGLHLMAEVVALHIWSNHQTHSTRRPGWLGFPSLQFLQGKTPDQLPGQGHRR